MIAPEAIYRFLAAQKHLLRRTYDAAWQTGVANYQPDQDPDSEPSTPRHVAEAGLAGAALLAIRRAYKYVPPASPDPVRRAVALAPAFRSLNAMHTELAELSPANVAQSQLATIAAVDSGGKGLSHEDATAQAFDDWMGSNAWRLDNGDSVAWAGEQSGGAEAADADGQLLQWTGADDDRECDDCRELSAMPPLPLSEWPAQPGDGSTECNVGCFAAGTIVEGRVEGGLRVLYDGPMVEMETRVGHRLTLTANHPVLTPHGFVAAGALREGDYVVSDRRQMQGAVALASMPEPQREQDPALIEDIFQAWAQRYASVYLRACGVDLYGDARFLQGDVHVVVPESALLNDRPLRAAQKVGQRILVPSATSPALLAGSGALGQRWLALRTSAARRMGCGYLRGNVTFSPQSAPYDFPRLAGGTSTTGVRELGLRSPATPSVRSAQRFDGVAAVPRFDQRCKRCGRRRRECTRRVPRGRALPLDGRRIVFDARPFDVAGFGAIAEIDAALTEPAGQSRADDARFVAEVLERFSGLVAPDEIVKVRHFDFAGHVYDLQSPLGWISANGILAANCRCELEPADISIQPGDDYDPQLSDAQTALQDKLMNAQSQALAAMMPDAAYLD